jgi:hypothetical protein
VEIVLGAIESLLKAQQRPTYPVKMRVWATLLLHTRAYQGGRVLRLVRGKLVPMAPADIATELNKVAEKYRIGRFVYNPITSEAVRRCIADFEEEGLCQRLSALPLIPVLEQRNEAIQ